MSGAPYLLVTLLGVILVSWGMSAAFRWPSPRNLLPACAVLLGVVAVLAGVLLSVLPRFFQE